MTIWPFEKLLLNVFLIFCLLSSNWDRMLKKGWNFLKLPKVVDCSVVFLSMKSLYCSAARFFCVYLIVINNAVFLCWYLRILIYRRVHFVLISIYLIVQTPRNYTRQESSHLVFIGDEPFLYTYSLHNTKHFLLWCTWEPFMGHMVEKF